MRVFDYEKMIAALLEGSMETVVQLTNDAILNGVHPGNILNNGLIKGMSVVGEKFKNNEFYLPEVLLAARAMQAGMDILKPHIASTGLSPVGKMVIGTVRGDLHDIGKNLVGIMMRGAGFDVIDLGIDVPPETFIEAVREHKPEILGLSALLTTTMLSMREVIDYFDKTQIRSGIKIMVGGAPVTERFAREIGADAYASDAVEAVDKALNIIRAPSY